MVWRSDWNPREDDGVSVVVADVGDIGGWRGLGGAEGPLLRMDEALECTLLGAPLFFEPKERKKDH